MKGKGKKEGDREKKKMKKRERQKEKNSVGGRRKTCLPFTPLINENLQLISFKLLLQIEINLYGNHLILLFCSGKPQE